jgi:hypothetical protein
LRLTIKRLICEKSYNDELMKISICLLRTASAMMMMDASEVMKTKKNHHHDRLEEIRKAWAVALSAFLTKNELQRPVLVFIALAECTVRLRRSLNLKNIDDDLNWIIFESKKEFGSKSDEVKFIEEQIFFHRHQVNSGSNGTRQNYAKANNNNNNNKIRIGNNTR